MTNGVRSTATALLLPSGTAPGAAAVLAKARGGLAYDASQLPQTKGVVKRYTLGPRGEIDGVLPADGTEIELPPHLSTQTAFALRPGAAASDQAGPDDRAPPPPPPGRGPGAGPRG
ncbi:MAG: hypothetical protein DI527_02615 [Chelatococcus sp.]|nr:MAG: hypothetical protein DI527_02615 [Chelatococcus sp.]